MNQALQFLQQRCPGGFYYKDLTTTDLAALNWNAFAQAEDPLFFKLHSSQLEHVLSSLVEEGVGPASSCALLIGEKAIVGTLGDIAAKARRHAEDPLHLLITDSISAWK